MLKNKPWNVLAEIAKRHGESLVSYREIVINIGYFPDNEQGNIKFTSVATVIRMEHTTYYIFLREQQILVYTEKHDINLTDDIVARVGGDFTFYSDPTNLYSDILNTRPIEEQVELIDTVDADWGIIGKLKGLKWLQ